MTPAHAHLPEYGEQRLVNDAILCDVVDGADDGPRGGASPAETRWPEPLGVDPHEATPSRRGSAARAAPAVVDQGGGHEPRQPRRVDADVARRLGRVVVVHARTPHVHDHSLTTGQRTLSRRNYRKR